MKHKNYPYIDLKNKNLRELLYFSTNKYGKKTAFVSLNTNLSYSFAEAYELIQQVKRILLQDFELQKGDKVAIWAENMPNWGIVYFAITTAGLVAVPLLPDFSSHEVQNILKHSESKAIFVSQRLISKYKEVKTNIDKVILVEDFTLFKDLKNFNTKTNIEILSEPQSPAEEPHIEDTDLAVIIYTSGTTGKSKGVMLTHKNIVSNVLDVQYVQWIEPGEKFLSILPLSHSYENTVGFLAPFLHGATVFYLEKPPTASLLLPALKKVRPTFMLSVPLIIEKIYRKNILPQINAKAITQKMYKTAPGRKILNRMAGKKLMELFGGKLKFFGIGGAKLDPEVEKFMREAKFPYAIGYGLTETAPLLAGGNPQIIRFQSCGLPLRSVELRINNPDPETGEGEIVAKGPNIMQGYYKEPELTQQVFTEDGWFRTGDLGVFDKDGFLYIRGRLKNMILGPSGENIYPEEIEAIINSFDMVNESIVIEKDGKLVALVHFDFEALEQRAVEWFNTQKHKAGDYLKEKGQQAKDSYDSVNDYLKVLTNQLKDYVNSRVNKSSRIAKIEIQKEPFVKTATKKIKRYLYQKK